MQYSVNSRNTKIHGTTFSWFHSSRNKHWLMFAFWCWRFRVLGKWNIESKVNCFSLHCMNLAPCSGADDRAYCTKHLPEKSSGYFYRSFFFSYGKVNGKNHANLRFQILPELFSGKSFMQWAPGFPNRGGVKDYVSAAYITSAGARSAKSLTAGVQGPLKGPGSSRALAPGPGRGALPLLTVVGTCRWTGYDFPVITIGTGYLNRPNWLLAGYSVYHRVASQPTMFMTGPRSRHQRRCVRDATDFEFLISFYCKTTIEQGIYPRCAIATGYAYESF